MAVSGLPSAKRIIGWERMDAGCSSVRSLSVAARGGAAGLRLVQYLTLDFFDEKGQVGAGEAQVGSRNAVVFDVRRHVLVMGMRAGQRRVFG